MRSMRPRQAASSSSSSSARAAHGVGVAAHELLAAVAVLSDEPGALEHGDVLLHRGEAHRVAAGERRDRLARRRPSGARCRAGWRRRARGTAGRRLVTIYNHMVVRYQLRLVDVSGSSDCDAASRRLGWRSAILSRTRARSSRVSVQSNGGAGLPITGSARCASVRSPEPAFHLRGASSSTPLRQRSRTNRGFHRLSESPCSQTIRPPAWSTYGA